MFITGYSNAGPKPPNLRDLVFLVPVDLYIFALSKTCTPTVPNNSYRFWADLLIDGHVFDMADIHKDWSKMP